MEIIIEIFQKELFNDIYYICITKHCIVKRYKLFKAAFLDQLEVDFTFDPRNLTIFSLTLLEIDF